MRVAPEAPDPDPDAGTTAELAISQLHNRLATTNEDLRDQLPGIETERRVTDWGRSERVERLVDRTVCDFLYRYWFRVEVEGIENVPDQGGALLVANRSRAILTDGAMIAKAIKEEHRWPRPLYVSAERQIDALPGLGMLVTKLGGVAAHPANLQRLLFDERELVLAFPEGPGGGRKPINHRYRLQRFDDRDVGAAVHAEVPVIPVAVLGAEEAAPSIARVLPVAPLIPLPAKFKLRFLEPVAPDDAGPEGSRDQSVRALTDEIRALIQENLLEMVAERDSVWLG